MARTEKGVVVEVMGGTSIDWDGSFRGDIDRQPVFNASKVQDGAMLESQEQVDFRFD